MDGYRVWFAEKGKAVLQPFSVREPKSDEVQVKVDFTLISAGTEIFKIERLDEED